MKTFNYLTIFSLVAAVCSITVFATLFPVDLRSKKTKNLFVSVYMPDNFKPKYGPKRIAYSGMVGVDSVQSLDKAFSQENCLWKTRAVFVWCLSLDFLNFHCFFASFQSKPNLSKSVP